MGRGILIFWELKLCKILGLKCKAEEWREQIFDNNDSVKCEERVLNWTWSMLVMVCPPFIPLPRAGNLELNFRVFWMKRNFSNNCITIIIIFWAESPVWSSFITKSESGGIAPAYHLWMIAIDRISEIKQSTADLLGKAACCVAKWVCMVNDGMINVALINIFIADECTSKTDNLQQFYGRQKRNLCSQAISKFSMLTDWWIDDCWLTLITDVSFLSAIHL